MQICFFATLQRRLITLDLLPQVMLANHTSLNYESNQVFSGPQTSPQDFFLSATQLLPVLYIIVKMHLLHTLLDLTSTYFLSIDWIHLLASTLATVGILHLWDIIVLVSVTPTVEMLYKSWKTIWPLSP